MIQIAALRGFKNYCWPRILSNNNNYYVLQPSCRVSILYASYIISGGCRISERGSRKGSEREARAKILATPPQQLVIDTWTTTEHAHTNAASAILCQVHMQLSRRLSNCLSSLL